MRGLRSRGAPGGTVKHEIPSERCGEAGGHRRAGAVDGPEGRSRKGRMGKDGGRGRESSAGRAGFIGAVHRDAVNRHDSDKLWRLL